MTPSPTASPPWPSSARGPSRSTGQGQLGRRSRCRPRTGMDPSEVHTFTDAKNIGLYSACKNQKTAWDVLKFATSEEQDGKLLEMTGQMPIRTDLADDLRRLLRVPPGLHDLRRPGLAHRRGAQRAELGRDLAGDPRHVLVRGDLRQDHVSTTGSRRRRTKAERARRPVVTETSVRAGGRPAVGSARQRVLGRQPLGILFAAPYAIFLAAIFAYPLGLAVWISFHDYFFAAPGAQVDRPFVGFENYVEVLERPGRAAVVRARRRVPGDQRAADRGALTGARHRAQLGDPARARSCGSPTTCPT